MDLFRARWIIPVEAAPIEDGCLAVEDGRIADLGAADRIAGPASRHDTIQDLGDCLLLPGLINAHTHLELTHYRGRLPRGDLWAWIDALIALRQAPGADQMERDAVRAGAAESLAAGVTCVGDISRTGMAAEILRDAPIRKVCFTELISGAARPPDDAHSLKARLREQGTLAEPGRLWIGVSPHTPYTVNVADLAAAAALSRSTGAPFTMHLLETAEEARLFAGDAEPPPDLLRRRTAAAAARAARGEILDLLDRLGVLDCAPLLAHANYVTDAQIEGLAASSASIVWCPRAHAFFGHAPHRWQTMLDRGLNVCLGTDSAASGASLSILDEMRRVRAEAPGATAETILAMGTIRAARGLGLEPLLGSLKPGKRADFITVPLDAGGPADPLRNLLETETRVSATWIDGRRAGPPRA